MSKSIRVRLFLSVSSLVAFFVFLNWIFNNQFLEKYYIYQKKAILIKNSELISSMYQGNPSDIALELERIENNLGGNIIIRSQDDKIRYGPFFRILDQKRRELPFPFRPRIHKVVIVDQVTYGKYAFRTERDLELKLDFLRLKTNLKNGDILQIRIPLSAISESADIASSFMMFTGLLIIALGGIGAYFFASSFTNPIIKLKSIAQNMSRLDFSEKCQINRKDELGELASSINNLSDQLSVTLTKLNEKNQQLLLDIEKERKIDEMRKELVSSVSHELRTPLALIQGYSEGLKEKVIDDEEEKNYYCEVIIDEANKMDKLLKDLLNLSQIESGYFQLERTVFDLSLLLDQVLSKYSNIFAEKKIELEVTREARIMVDGDKIRVEQILVNYLNNAINHLDDKRKIKIKAEVGDKKVRVWVFNTGKNIPEESLDKIWQSFYKIDKSRTREYGGTGLGLSIVRAIQELHYNGYGVENREDGVQFWFDLDKNL